jgi:hypothetical protein
VVTAEEREMILLYTVVLPCDRDAVVSSLGKYVVLVRLIIHHLRLGSKEDTIDLRLNVAVRVDLERATAMCAGELLEEEGELIRGDEPARSGPKVL